MEKRANSSVFAPFIGGLRSHKWAFSRVVSAPCKEWFDPRSHAKGREERRRRIGFYVRGITALRGKQLAPVIAHFSCPSSGRNLSTKVALCLQAYTSVAPKSFFWAPFVTFLNSSSPFLIGISRTFCGHSMIFQITSCTFRSCLGKRGGYSVWAPRFSTERVSKATFCAPQGL